MRCQQSFLYWIYLSVLLLFVSYNANAQYPQSKPARELWVTSDSPPGWAPTATQQDQAERLALAYFAARDAGELRTAYEMLGPGLQQLLPFEKYAAETSEFNNTAGKVSQRKINRITWTKDAPSAPTMGLYVAVDFVAQFANIDRYCGYIALHLPLQGAAFHVVREQVSQMDNANAEEIAKQPNGDVEREWKKAAAYCPNYVALPLPLEEADENTIGYPTVVAAIDALKKRSGVEFSNNRGWTIAVDEDAQEVWSFTPEGHPAHPSAVKRAAVAVPGGGSRMTMSVHCEADKISCDDLVRSFEELNAQAAREAIKPRPQQTPINK